MSRLVGAASFATAPAAYAADRPQYPPELFAWIAGMCRERRVAWDCATGNGQAAIGLARWFERVEATDVSAEQIGHAFAAPNIRYSTQPAERTGFADGSFDLVAVAQALHWFDYRSFWPEVRRVARPGAFFCAWGYAWFERSADLGPLHALYLDPLTTLLKPYWSANNAILWDGYRSDDIAFPFERVEAPSFAISLEWSVERLIAYVHTWSALKQALGDDGTAARIARLEEQARASLAPLGAMRLSLPLTVVAARIA